MQETRSRPVTVALLTAIVTILSLAVPAAIAHEERGVTQPDEGTFPSYRSTGPSVVVCKADSGKAIVSLPAPLRARNLALLEQCQFEHIQAAINHVEDEGEPGTRILVLPGVYREEPSIRSHDEFNGVPTDEFENQELVDFCGQHAEGASDAALDYEVQVKCPHLQNMIAVHGDSTPGNDNDRCDGNLCNLQIEGTGGRPEDVIIDGKFIRFLNGIHADRADGLHLSNYVAQHFEFNGTYILETAGATIEDAEGNYNHEYGFLSFVAWVLYENCDGRANGDSSFYPGASPNVNQTKGLIPLHREDMVWTTEVRGCRGHHNALGYSGTTGNSVWGHHNEFDHNSTGWSHDSLFPDHPGTPQNHALLENNLVHSNNSNFYAMTTRPDNTCDDPLNERDYEDGAVCPAVPLPVGTGIIAPGGNFNWYRNNQIWNNWRQGTFQFWIPAEVRQEAPAPEAHFRMECGPDGDAMCPYEETSHWNTYSGNLLDGSFPLGHVQPNGVDFTWDVEGEGNCWAQEGDSLEPNVSANDDITYHVAESREVNLPTFPSCSERDQAFSYGDVASVSTIAPAAPCVNYSSSSNPQPEGCDWFNVPPEPDGREPASATLERLAGNNRIETAILASREGYPTNATTVVLARSDLYPDALAGAPLAHARGGPLLLTGGGGLDPAVAKEIQRLGATNAILLGGEAALSTQVEADLRGLGLRTIDVVRIAGRDRFETAVKIAETLPATDALVAKGVDVDPNKAWADALAASPAAALLERPILLTAGDALPGSVAAFLDKGLIEAVDIVGGTAAVSENVEKQLAARLDEVERIAGKDRYATSLEVAKFAHKAGADPNQLWLTTGANWPDGIAAGSAIAVDEGVMLLVPDTLAGTPAATWLDSVNPFYGDGDDEAAVKDVLENVRILGGTAAVSEQVATDLKDGYGVSEGNAVGRRSVGNRLWNGSLNTSGVVGSARVAETLVGSTRVWVEVAGLEPNHAYEAHVRTGSCASGSDLEFADGHGLHVSFTTDANGVAVANETHYEQAEGDPGSVVIQHADDGHSHGGGSTVCADL